jgi:CubicO group peptidase (beta-lactamase class C family)
LNFLSIVFFLCAREGKESHKPAAQVTLAWYLQFFLNEPLKFEPGKGWAYGNAGMIVAGLIVEKVSGQTTSITCANTSTSPPA